MSNIKYAVITISILIIAGVGILSLNNIFNFYGGNNDELVVSGSKLQEVLQIIKGNDVVAILFESTTCPACKRVRPYWNELVLEKHDEIKFVTITFDPTLPKEELNEITEVFNYFDVEVVPTLIVN